MKSVRRKVVWVLIGLESLRSFGSFGPSPSWSPRVGIMSLGAETSYSEQQVTHVLEKRVQHWVENFPELRAHADTLKLGSTRGPIEEELTRARTKQLVASLETQFKKDNLSQVSIRDIDRLEQWEKKIQLSNEDGPLLQRALLIESAFWNTRKKAARARALLLEAIRLHPEGEVPEISDWEGENRASLRYPPAFIAQIQRATNLTKRICTVEVSTTPSNAKLAVNGFPMGAQRTFHLASRNLYRFRAEHPGYGEQEAIFSCQIQSHQKLTLSLSRERALARGKLPSSERARGVAEFQKRTGIQSLIVIDRERNRYRLYLYTPGKALDEIPLTRPISTNDVLASNGEEALPIASDAFLRILQKQDHPLRIADVMQAESPQRESLAPVGLESSLRGSVHENRWYNSTIFWLVAGGLAAGSAAVLLATHGSSVRPTQSKLNLVIK